MFTKHVNKISLISVSFQPGGIDEVNDERRDGEDEDEADLEIEI